MRYKVWLITVLSIVALGAIVALRCWGGGRQAVPNAAGLSPQLPEGGAGELQVEEVEQLLQPPLTKFEGKPYTVVEVVPPTTTKPEVEEHIAADPRDPRKLVAAISDLSGNTIVFQGLKFPPNITKYAFSSDNGAM